MIQDQVEESMAKVEINEDAVMKERRSSIQIIMKHPTLTSEQRRHSIQVLMDGRRRGSFGSTYAEAAKKIAEEFTSLSCASSCNSNTSSPTTNDHAFSTDRAGLISGNIVSTTKQASCSSSFCSSTCSVGFDGVVNQKVSPDEIRFLQQENNTTQSSSIPMIAFTLTGEPTGDPKQMEQNRPPCTHYNRNCSAISPCCGMVFGCRICHDECETLLMPFMNTLREKEYQKKNNKREEATSVAETRKRKQPLRMSIGFAIEHHYINRFDTQEVICRNCFTRQNSKSNKCINCSIQFGEYHCNICNLWMDSKDEPYHCHDCGICRIGGENNFKHCKGCGMCIDKLVFDNHDCRAGKFMSKCPVCYEDLFSSRSACHELPCKHSMHWHCFHQLSSVDIRCPICKKTMLGDEEMQEVWKELRDDIDAQPVPPDQTRVVDLLCYDCEITSKNRRWHPLGVHCLKCGGFNTSADVKMSGIEAFDFLNQLEAKRRKSV